MVDTIGATTSIIGHNLLYQSSCFKDKSYKRQTEPCQLLYKGFISRQQISSLRSNRITRQHANHFVSSTIKSHAMELTKEAYLQRNDKIPGDLYFTTDTRFSPSRLWPPPNKADKPSLHNPLLRQERLGCGWLGVIMELEGVIIEDDPELEKQAWLILSQEEGKSPPPAFLLKRIEGMKNEQAVSEVLCWSRDPSELRRLASRKEEIHQSLQGGIFRIRSGSREFLTTLMRHKIPIAVASTRPRKNLQEAIRAISLEGSFDAVVTAEDVYRGKPDPEMFAYAAQLLNFIPERCIVFGNSNSTVEAAHDACMKCVAVASKHPLYELGAADLVVRRLDELSIVDLKNLADVDSPEFGPIEGELEMEEEEQISLPSAVAVDDFPW